MSQGPCGRPGAVRPAWACVPAVNAIPVATSADSSSRRWSVSLTLRILDPTASLRYRQSRRTVVSLFATDLPIVQAPMAGVQGSALAIAVSNAGGLGSLPVALLSLDRLRDELAAV